MKKQFNYLCFLSIFILFFSAHFNVLKIPTYIKYLFLFGFDLFSVFFVNNFELSHFLDETLHSLMFFYIKIKF